jgi:hypothetical protein
MFPCPLRKKTKKKAQDFESCAFSLVISADDYIELDCKSVIPKGIFYKSQGKVNRSLDAQITDPAFYCLKIDKIFKFTALF